MDDGADEAAFGDEADDLDDGGDEADDVVDEAADDDGVGPVEDEAADASASA